MMPLSRQIRRLFSVLTIVSVLGASLLQGEAFARCCQRQVVSSQQGKTCCSAPRPANATCSETACQSHCQCCCQPVEMSADDTRCSSGPCGCIASRPVPTVPANDRVPFEQLVPTFAYSGVVAVTLPPAPRLARASAEASADPFAWAGGIRLHRIHCTWLC